MSKWQSERSIHEMLKDTPPLRESSDAITSGTEPSFPTSRSMPFTPTYETANGGGAGAGAGAAAAGSTLVRAAAGGSKLESLRSWGVTTYKCTKQILYEKLGKTSRTVDTELEAQIEALRETQRKYLAVLRLSTALAAQLAAVHHTQRALADAFAELAQKSPELRDPFLYNADSQRSIARNGETLVLALQLFNSSLATLAARAMEDTLVTARAYEAARVQYDAYRTELEAAPAPHQPLKDHTQRLWQAYARLRDDSAVKLQLLHQNRIKVMNKQLVMFHNAVAAYFSGNGAALEAAVRHFNIRPPAAAAGAAPAPAAGPHPPAARAPPAPPTLPASPQ